MIHLKQVQTVQKKNTATFTTKANPAPAEPENPVKPTDPETPVENPFAGKTFYGTGYGSSYDICKLDFTSDLKATLTYYGLGEAGDDLVFNSTYTVSDGIATLDYQGDKVTTTKIENDTFKVSKDGTEEHTISFTTEANPAPAEPETPVEPVLKTAAGYNCTKGKGELEWVDGVAVLQFELPANYVNNWIYPDNPNNSFSFYLETVAGSWQDDCYKAAQTVEIGGESVDLEIGKAGNNTVTSAESLAGKTLKLTFTGTETAIKCKAEIVE